jgi:hypothetical protein
VSGAKIIKGLEEALAWTRSLTPEQRDAMVRKQIEGVARAEQAVAEAKVLARFVDDDEPSDD